MNLKAKDKAEEAEVAEVDKVVAVDTMGKVNIVTKEDVRIFIEEILLIL